MTMKLNQSQIRAAYLLLSLAAACGSSDSDSGFAVIHGLGSAPSRGGVGLSERLGELS
jgi:hypothetical protein